MGFMGIVGIIVLVFLGLCLIGGIWEAGATRVDYKKANRELNARKVNNSQFIPTEFINHISKK